MQDPIGYMFSVACSCSSCVHTPPFQSAMAAGGGRARDHDFSGMDDDDPGLRAAKAEAMDGDMDSEEDEDYEAPVSDSA